MLITKFQTFGSCNHHRPAEDIPYVVAQNFQKWGSYKNYYMYHGGTNFACTARGPFIKTSYGYDKPIDEFDEVFRYMLHELETRLKNEDGADQGFVVAHFDDFLERPMFLPPAKGFIGYHWDIKRTPLTTADFTPEDIHLTRK